MGICYHNDFSKSNCGLQNSYISYDVLHKLSIPQPKQYLQVGITFVSHFILGIIEKPNIELLLSITISHVRFSCNHFYINALHCSPDILKGFHLVVFLCTLPWLKCWTLLLRMLSTMVTGEEQTGLAFWNTRFMMYILCLLKHWSWIRAWTYLVISIPNWIISHTTSSFLRILV